MPKQNKTNPRARVGYWLRWIKSAKKAAKKHWEDAKSAYSEYERMSRDSDSRDSANRAYPIYNRSCRKLESAYFARPPKVKCKRAHGIEDEMALTMCLIADRLGQWNVDNSGFAEAMQATVRDFIHAAKGAPQLIYESDYSEQPVTLQSMVKSEGEEPIYYEENPEEPIDDDEEVFQNTDSGEYFYNKRMPVEDTQKIRLAPLLYDEVLHTPNAKCPYEITEMAYKFCMPREEAEEKFNPKNNRKLPYTTSKEDDEDREKGLQYISDDEPGQYLHGWECWCLKTKTVYYVCEDWKTGILLKLPDPYGLEGFFPSPAFIISSKHRNSMYATPGWVFLEAIANQLHTLYHRIHRLIDSIRRRALVRGSPELVDELNRLDGEEFISTGNLDEILEKSTLADTIEYMPVKELVEALSEALKLKEDFKQEFYEQFGVPDILRGISDPQETAAAQELKTDNANDSFRVDKEQIINCARNCVEMMLDLSLREFSDEKIARICGYEFLEAGTPAEPPSDANPQGTAAILGHKERFFEALNKLRNDEERNIRIDFETDSTSFRDEAKELEKQRMISDTVLQGLATLSNIQHPGNMQVALKMLLAVLEAMGGTSQSEDMIKQAVAELKKAEAQPQQTPPDYEAMKIQVQQQKNQLDAQAKQQDLAVKAQKLELEGAAQVFDQRLAVAQENRAAAEQEFTQQLEALKHESEEKLNTFQALLDQALVALEKRNTDIKEMQAQIQAAESMMEESRLAKEQSSDALARVAEFMAMQVPRPEKAPTPPKAPDIHIHMPGAMRKKIIYDELGQIAGTEDQPINGGV